MSAQNESMPRIRRQKKQPTTDSSSGTTDTITARNKNGNLSVNHAPLTRTLSTKVSEVLHPGWGVHTTSASSFPWGPMDPFSGETLNAPRLVQEKEAVAFPSLVRARGCRKVGSRLSTGNCFYFAEGGERTCREGGKDIDDKRSFRSGGAETACRKALDALMSPVPFPRFSLGLSLSPAFSPS